MSIQTNTAHSERVGDATTAVHGPKSDVDLCPDRGWRAQFGHPRGLLGRLAGGLMAVKNAPMIAAAVDHLDVQPESRVLEIGFGHGVGIELLAAMAVRGTVTGVDPSDVMLAQAMRRNRGLVRDGRVDLRTASVATLPFPNASFDRALAVNSYQHWPDQGLCLAEVRRVLAPGGELLLALRMHEPEGGRFQSPGFTPEQVDAVRRQVEAAFEFVDVTQYEVGRRVTFVAASRGDRVLP